MSSSNSTRVATLFFYAAFAPAVTIRNLVTVEEVTFTAVSRYILFVVGIISVTQWL